MNTTRRRIYFRIAAVLLGLTPIVLLELGLRLAGVASDSVTKREVVALSAVDPDPLVDLHSLRPLFVRSVDGKRLEIGESRMNFFCPASFPVAKSSGTKRIFALGGSTTQGQPYLTETAFPKWLQLRLQATMPNESIEVINCGGISYASYRVAAILDEVLQHSPDMIILYTGHNEFLEARTYSRQRSVPRWLAKPLSLLEKLRIARITARFLYGETKQSPQKTTLPSEVDTLLDHSAGMDAYVRDAMWSDDVHLHFELTLARMVEACRQASVPLVLCVPASDLVNTPPFKSVPDPTLKQSRRNDVDRWMKEIESEAELAERIVAAESILRLDPDHALANYALGRWTYEADKGDQAKAILHLVNARDHDVCPLRATTRIVDSVRAHRSREGVYMIDTPELLDRRDASGRLIPDGAADPSWFVDHVHPTIEGHQQIAKRIYELLVHVDWVQPETDDESTYNNLVEAHLRTLGEPYFGRAKQRLEGVNRWSRRIK